MILFSTFLHSLGTCDSLGERISALETSTDSLQDQILELHATVESKIASLQKDLSEKLCEITRQLNETASSLINAVQTAHSPTTVPATSEPDIPPTDNERHVCGGTGGWRSVAYLNMSDIRYHCPPGWKLHPQPARGCGRTSHERLTCDSAIFPVHGGPYTKICGRVLGYQFGATCAFQASHENNSITIDRCYVTGVSITRGNPRQHIWTYAVGYYERLQSTSSRCFCPCEQINSVFIPPFVGACWYCETGDNAPYGIRGYNLFSDDPLWDGDGCAFSNRCCQFDGPLYFTTTLHEPVTDSIEARICNYLSSQYSDVIVSQFELYVQ